MRFVVVSSDVVYPTGAMKDYESRFWLPFKGVTKPVYAIPGNHDWYDALEGFVATFFDRDSARLAMKARIAADGGMSSTTDARIEELIQRADFLRRQYGADPARRTRRSFSCRHRRSRSSRSTPVCCAGLTSSSSRGFAPSRRRAARW